MMGFDAIVTAGLSGGVGHLHWSHSGGHTQCGQKQDGRHLLLHSGNPLITYDYGKSCESHLTAFR